MCILNFAMIHVHLCKIFKCPFVGFFHFPVPGPISGLLCNATISKGSANITWSAPIEPNGIIEGYNVSNREVEGNAIEEFVQHSNIFIESLSEFILVCGCTLGLLCTLQT